VDLSGTDNLEDEGDEDEQMRKALCMSLGQSPSSSATATAAATATATAAVPVQHTTTEAASEAPAETPSLEGFSVSDFPAVLEPPASAGTGSAGGAKIQFRMLDGKKSVQVFDASQSLRDVAAWVSPHVVRHSGNTSARFELMYGFPQQKYSTLCSSAPDGLVAVHSAELNNAVMTVRVL